MAAHETGTGLQSESDKCLHSLTLFNIFLERTMWETLDDHESSIGGRIITISRFADGIVINAEE